MMVRCPACGRIYEIADNAVGRKAKCKCGALMLVPGVPTAPRRSSPPPPKPVAEPLAEPTPEPPPELVDQGPVLEPLPKPSSEPSAAPSSEPSAAPSSERSAAPSPRPSDEAVQEPPTQAEAEPSSERSAAPSPRPSDEAAQEPPTQAEAEPEASIGSIVEPATPPTPEPTARPAARPGPAARAGKVVEKEPPPLEPEPVVPPPYGIRTAVTGVLDAILNWFRFANHRVPSFDRYLRFLGTVGAYTLLVAGAIYLLHHGVMAATQKRFGPVWVGLAGFLVALILHYAAAKFAWAGIRLVRNYPLRISSPAFPDCVGLLAVAAMLAVVVMGITESVRAKGMAPLWVHLVAAAALAHLALIALNPRTVNIETVADKSTSGGEEGLSVIGFVIRLVVLMGPVVLGAGVVLGTGGMIWFAIVSWSKTAASAAASDRFQAAVGLVARAGLAPFVAYVQYVLLTLSVDLCLAILGIERNTRGR